MNLLLRDARVAASFANVLHIGFRRNERENFRRDQVVVKDNIGCLQQTQRFDRKQPRIAWSRAYQIYFTNLAHTVARPAGQKSSRSLQRSETCNLSPKMLTLQRRRPFVKEVIQWIETPNGRRRPSRMLPRP